MFELGIYSAIAPFVLLLLSSVWSYPAVLEEVVKWGILRLSTDSQLLTVKHGALVGIVFGLSEAVLFSSNAWMSGDWSSMVSRLLLTVPMHAATGTITAWGIPLRSNELRRDAVVRQLVCLAIAMGIHGVFNNFVK